MSRATDDNLSGDDGRRALLAELHAARFLARASVVETVTCLTHQIGF